MGGLEELRRLFGMLKVANLVQWCENIFQDTRIINYGRFAKKHKDGIVFVSEAVVDDDEDFARTRGREPGEAQSKAPLKHE